MEPVVSRSPLPENDDWAGESPRSLMFVISDIGFFLSHRLPLALEAERQGFRFIPLICIDAAVIWLRNCAVC